MSEADDTRRPDDGPRGEPLALLPQCAGDRDRVLVDADDGSADERRHAQPFERACRTIREPRREQRQYAIVSFDEQDPRGASVDRAEVAVQRVARDLGDLSLRARLRSVPRRPPRT
jgi:hypothetical protein